MNEMRQPAPPKVIACGALRDEVSQLAGYLEVEFVEAKLHDVPDKLRTDLGARISATPGSRTIILVFGRCSNVKGTKTPIHHAATAWYSWIRPPSRSRRLILGTISTGSM